MISAEEVPEKWCWSKLDALRAGDAPIVYGILQPGPDREAGVPYVRPTEIQADQIRVDRLRRTTFQIAKKYGRSSLLGGDILLSIVGTIGKVALVPPSLSGANITQSSARIRPDTGLVDGAFLRFALKAPQLKRQYDNVRLGTGVPRLNIGHVRDLDVPLAPLNEQRRIVAKIEALQERSDAAKQALDAIPPLLERFRQSVLAAAFRGDLTRDWRAKNPDVEPASALLERIRAERKSRFIEDVAEKARAKAEAKAVAGGKAWTQTDNEAVLSAARVKAENKYTAPQAVDTKELPPVPSGWCWARADELAWEITVGHVGQMKTRYVPSGVPFLRSQNVRENRFDQKGLLYIDEAFHSELSKSSLRPGDLLVVRSGAPGTACVLPAEVERANCADLVITRLLPGCVPDLLSLFINSKYAKVQVRDAQVGVAQQHFNVGSMKDLLVPVMSELEQLEILKVMTTRFEWVRSILIRVKEASKLMSALDQSVLGSAFRGELVPQQHGDEPASELLRRTREQRVHSV